MTARLKGYLRGEPLTIGRLKELSDGAVVWVCYHELANPEGSRIDAPSRIEWTGNGDLILDDVGMDFDPGTFPDDAECFAEGFGEVDMRLYEAILVLGYRPPTDSIGTPPAKTFKDAESYWARSENGGLSWKPVTADLRKRIRPRCGDLPRSYRWTTRIGNVRVFKNRQEVRMWIPGRIGFWMSARPKPGQSLDEVARLIVQRQ